MRDPSQLMACVQEHHVTIAQFVPSLLASTSVATHLSEGHSLKRVFTGERLFLWLWRKRWPRLGTFR